MAKRDSVLILKIVLVVAFCMSLGVPVRLNLGGGLQISRPFGRTASYGLMRKCTPSSCWHMIKFPTKDPDISQISPNIIDGSI